MQTRAADKLYDRVNYLFIETLTGGLDSNRTWKAVSTLRRMGSRIVFDKAKLWCASPQPMKRAKAAAILSQLRRPITPKPPFGSTSEPIFIDESFALISGMIVREQEIYALQSQIFAFGHLDKLDAVPIIVPYVDHPNEDIRYAVACSLGSLHEHPDSTAGLTNLPMTPMRMCEIGRSSAWVFWATQTPKNFDNFFSLISTIRFLTRESKLLHLSLRDTIRGWLHRSCVYFKRTGR